MPNNSKPFKGIVTSAKNSGFLEVSNVILERSKPLISLYAARKRIARLTGKTRHRDYAINASTARLP